MEESQQVPQRPPQKLYHIGGVQVLLPVKPYPSQLAMMGQIMRGLRHRQNCLLESPTGTGKSLALLCSTLAWQREQTEKAHRYNALIDSGVTDPEVLARVSGLPLLPTQPMPGAAPASQSLASSGGFFFEDEDDFKSQPSSSGHLEMDDATAMQHEMDAMSWERRPRRLRVPKIFLGTRTHKQVAQIIKELRRTAYSNVRMVVLSSREHSCIHPVVSTSSNKNEKCHELTDPSQQISCTYYLGVHRIKGHDSLAQHGGLQGAWDIEDLVRVGHKVKACPYFTARSLVGTAELVVCPYNYLVDPTIRELMKISLKNHVLVLDEAHNIEDSAREAASCTVTQEEMKEACIHLKNRKSSREECEKLANMLSALIEWIDDNNDNLTDYTDFERSGKIYTGTEIIAILDHLGVGSDNYSELQKCFTLATEEAPDEENVVALNALTKKVLRDLFLVFHFLFKNNMKHKDDYRVALVKDQVRKKSTQKIDGWIKSKSALQLEYSINFWCLNPAVAFSPISNETHSIILTSGTLSPMSSFQSELGVPFKIQLEANHVVDQNQVFVGTVGHGPQGKPLLATYQHADTWEFQDELGELVLDVCHIVPGGILCFLPSYAMLNKLHDRWQNTGVWDEISKVKEAMTEQRKGEEFERNLTNFYATIRNTQMEGAGSINGVLFMAVYRGKVSEGLDFADDNARAVIAVGIPFPNIKNIQVDLKRKYNNAFHHSRKLLTGKEWYEIQAYRAINQALGRCIRHRYDWGALLLVDLRFHKEGSTSGQQENQYTRGLSKWVRNKVTRHKNFSMTTHHLREFVKNMQTNPPQPPMKPGDVFLTTSKEKIKSSLTRESETCCDEVIDSPQTTSTSENADYKSHMKSSQDINTCDKLKNISDDQKEYNAVSRKDSSSNHEKSEQRYGSVSCESGKENEKMSQSRKRSLIAMDYQDLEDFNLALSPITPQEHQPPRLTRKRVGEKKGVIFINID